MAAFNPLIAISGLDERKRSLVCEGLRLIEPRTDTDTLR